jgi:hypothetical protein
LSRVRRRERARPPDRVEVFVERYWAAFRLGLAFHRELPQLEMASKTRGRRKHRPGRNLQIETLRFLTDFDVPFTNNLANRT